MKTKTFIFYFWLGIVNLLSIQINGFNIFSGLGLFMCSIFGAEALIGVVDKQK